MYVEGWVDPPGEDGVTVVESPVKEVYVVTDAFLRQGNGTYRLAFEARAKGEQPVALEAHFFSNEKRKVAKFVVASDGAWHRFSEAMAIGFDPALPSAALRADMGLNGETLHRLSGAEIFAKAD